MENGYRENWEEYDELEVIKELMSGIPMKHIRKVQKIIKDSKEKNTLHFLEMRFLNAYEKIYDALEEGDKEIEINKRVRLILNYSVEDQTITIKCECNNQMLEKIIEDDLYNIHKVTSKILSFVLDSDKDFFKVRN